jgi:molybdate transport system substrate-binding protein
MRINLLSGGAAQGLVTALSPRFKAETGCEIAATFGAVGAMRDRLLSGEPADVLILTAAMIAELVSSGRVAAGSPIDVGVVDTAIAVRAGEPRPNAGSADELRTALLAAECIYYPDPQRATAGIHFARVLDELGIAGPALEARARTYPNGATAMHELALSRGVAIGCTQATEILSTPGVALVRALPRPFALATVYTAGVATNAASPDAAHRLCALLAHATTRAQREHAGFRSP